MEELLKETKDAVQRMAIAMETLVGELVKARVTKEFEQEKPKIQQPQEYQPFNPATPLGACNKCGAQMKLSKQNKPYCSAKCWLPRS
jgi:hypothetical protein